MPKPNYSTWLTKQQAADAIGVSTKTIEKLVHEKRLQMVYWKRPETGARVAVYHPEDVQRLRKERNPEAEPFVLPTGNKGSAELKELAPAALPTGEQFFQALAAAAAAATSQSSQRESEVRLAERLFLTIAEAAKYSALPQAHLRRLIAAGKLSRIKTGAGWRIRRRDLEKL